MGKEKIVLTTQDETGHSQVEIKWDPNDPDQVKNIEEMFKEMKAKGFLFFKVKKKMGIKTKGKSIEEFDSGLKKMFMEKDLDWQPVELDEDEPREAQFVDVDKEKIESNTEYVAAQPLVGG